MLLDFELLKIKYNLDITGIIHIGAHYGEELDLYFKNNISDIICFEPLKTNFSILEKKKVNNCDLFNLALGNDNKTVKMYVDTTNQGQSSSILKPFIHLQQYPSVEFSGEVEVNMIRLDDFMTFYLSNSINKQKKFNMINIDVQGYELEVFKGSEKTLQNIEYIITEINNEYLYENCVIVNELDSYLNKFNFKRVETNCCHKTWGDAFYIKYD